MKKSIILGMNELAFDLLKKISNNYKNLNLEVTPVQGKILMFLYHNHEPLCQKDIETLMSCNKSTLSAILNTMEKNNLITRNDSLEDSRRKIISLTEKSLRITKLVEKNHKRIDEILCSDITLEEYITFDEVLTKIRKNMERM